MKQFILMLCLVFALFVHIEASEKQDIDKPAIALEDDSGGNEFVYQVFFGLEPPEYKTSVNVVNENRQPLHSTSLENFESKYLFPLPREGISHKR